MVGRPIAGQRCTDVQCAMDIIRHRLLVDCCSCGCGAATITSGERERRGADKTYWHTAIVCVCERAVTVHAKSKCEWESGWHTQCKVNLIILKRKKKHTYFSFLWFLQWQWAAAQKLFAKRRGHSTKESTEREIWRNWSVQFNNFISHASIFCFFCFIRSSVRTCEDVLQYMLPLLLNSALRLRGKRQWCKWCCRGKTTRFVYYYIIQGNWSEWI